MYPLRLGTKSLSAEEIRGICVTPLDTKIHTAVTTSLRRLSIEDVDKPAQKPYIDCLLLQLNQDMSGHTNQEVLDAWDILETYVPERIRHLGITNMTLSMLELLYDTAKIKPAVVQNRFTMARRNEIALRNFCRERSIVYQTYSKLSKEKRALLMAGR